MQVGNMMAFISYTMQIVMRFMILTMVSVILPRAEVAAERVDEVITCPTSINDPASPKLPAASSPRGELTFRDVSFQYPDARADVISGVNFTTHAGQMLGIIGSTGSGKSTLVQLIPRLYDVTGGSISLDGIDVRDMTLSELRRRIGYIPQQGRLFSGTVKSNLKFAGDMVSDDDMHQPRASPRPRTYRRARGRLRLPHQPGWLQCFGRSAPASGHRPRPGQKARGRGVR